MDIIAYYGPGLPDPGDHVQLSGAIPEPNPQDFDTARISVLMRGTVEQMHAAFPAGAVLPSHSQMFCKGPRVTRNEYGCVWADVEYIGYWTAVSGGTAYTQRRADLVRTATSRETEYPIQIDNITYVGLKGPNSSFFHSGPLSLPERPWRSRITDLQHGGSVSGLYIGTTDLGVPTEEQLSFTSPPTSGLKVWTTSDIPDPVVAKAGWQLTNFAAKMRFKLGVQKFYDWNASVVYIQALSP